MKNSIAIGIPVFNNVSQFRECIDSLSLQTHKAFDVFVFDDASTQDYKNEISQVASFEINYRRHSQNLGALGNMSFAYNFLSEIYQYVMIMHEDDLLHPQYLAYINAALQADAMIDFVISHFSTFTQPGRIESLKDKIPFFFASKEDLCRLFLELQPLAFGSVIYNTKRFKKMALDIDEYAEFADRPYLLNGIPETGKVAVIKDQIYFYRSHGIADNRWKMLRARHVFRLLKLYKTILNPQSISDVRAFKKAATAFIFLSIGNLRLACSFPGFVAYLAAAFKHGLISVKYALLRNRVINSSGKALKTVFR